MSVGKAYILEAALEFWGMQSLADLPSKHVPPVGIQHMSKERKSAYFHKHIGAGVTKHRNGMEQNGIYRNKPEYTGTRRNDAGMDKNGTGMYRNEPE